MRRILAAALLVFAAACNSDSSLRAESVPGTYTLQSVNGASIPYTYPGPYDAGVTREELLSDQFLINSGGSFTEVGQTRTTFSGGGTQVDSFTDGGTWSLSGNQILLRFNDTATESATIDGNEMRFDTGNGSAIYRKQ